MFPIWWRQQWYQLACLLPPNGQIISGSCVHHYPVAFRECLWPVRKNASQSIWANYYPFSRSVGGIAKSSYREELSFSEHVCSHMSESADRASSKTLEKPWKFFSLFIIWLCGTASFDDLGVIHAFWEILTPLSLWEHHLSRYCLWCVDDKAKTERSLLNEKMLYALLSVGAGIKTQGIITSRNADFPPDQ